MRRVALESRYPKLDQHSFNSVIGVGAVELWEKQLPWLDASCDGRPYCVNRAQLFSLSFVDAAKAGPGQDAALEKVLLSAEADNQTVWTGGEPGIAMRASSWTGEKFVRSSLRKSLLNSKASDGGAECV